VITTAGLSLFRARAWLPRARRVYGLRETLDEHGAGFVHVAIVPDEEDV
jgi:hypothetical protein